MLRPIDLNCQTHGEYIACFNISLLKRWRTALYRKEEEEVPIELEGLEEPHYEVQKILIWRNVKGTGRREYLTLWIGYPLEEATWEPQESLTIEKHYSAAYRKINHLRKLRID